MRSPETSLLTEAEGAGGFLEAEAEVRAGGARAGRCSSGTHGAVWPRPVFGAAGAAGGAGGWGGGGGPRLVRLLRGGGVRGKLWDEVFPEGLPRATTSSWSSGALLGPDGVFRTHDPVCISLEPVTALGGS